MAGLLALVLSYLGCSPVALSTVPATKKSIEVQGHRGARGLRPENTLAGFEFALKTGVDVLEMDLGVSKDGVVVLYHDQWINPSICSGAKRVPLYSLRLSEIQKLDCGSLRNSRFPDQQPVPQERVPTLEEVLTWIKNHPSPQARTVRLNIEMKSDPKTPELAPSPEIFAELVINTIRKHEMLHRCVIQSFDHRTLQAAKKLEPSVTLSALIESRPPPGDPTSLSEIAIHAGASILSPQHEWLTSSDVQRLHASGILVIPWTANREADFDRLIKIGVDGIITDYPDRLIAFLKLRGLR